MNTSRLKTIIQAYLGVHKIRAGPNAHHRDTENTKEAQRISNWDTTNFEC
jgi:hypothetical protein